MMMIIFRNLAEFAEIEQFREFIEMKHCLVAAVLAKISDVLTKIHVLQMIGNITAITPLNALSEFADDLLVRL